MDLIVDSWHGREKLWKVFWLYNILISYILETIADSLLPKTGVMSIVIGVLIGLPWTIWITVSLWRCAYNTEFEVLGHLVRALIVLSFIFMFGLLFTAL